MAFERYAEFGLSQMLSGIDVGNEWYGEKKRRASIAFSKNRHQRRLSNERAIADAAPPKRAWTSRAAAPGLGRSGGD